MPPAPTSNQPINFKTGLNLQPQGLPLNATPKAPQLSPTPQSQQPAAQLNPQHVQGVTLDEASRTKLDGIVQKMTQNGETPQYIQNVVNDFKLKYGQPVQPPQSNPLRDAIWNGVLQAAKNIPVLGTILDTANTMKTGPQDIANQFNQGVEQIKQGFSDVQSPELNPAIPVESGLKIGAGAVGALSAPLAPSLKPISEAVQATGDVLGNIPALQKFAMSPAGDVTKRVVEDAGNAATIAGAVGGAKLSAPVENVLNKATAKTGSALGSGASQVLGASTGTGAASVRAAFNGGQAFLDALRDKTSPEEIIQTAKDAVQNIADTRRQEYVSNLEKIGQNTKALDISPIVSTLDKQLQAFGIKKTPAGTLDFSRSSIGADTAAEAKVQGVYDRIKNWGSQSGDRTPLGLDTLKKQLGDFYSESSSARAFVQAVKSQVSEVLNKQVPGYKDMTASYSKASQLLDEIKSATGIGGKAKADTIFSKLTTALKGDKEFRLQMLDQIQSKGAQPDLMAQISGSNMSSIIPKGLVGRGADITAAFGILGHFFNPQMIPMILATSPRVVGEFVSALGYSKPAVSLIVSTLNKVSAKGISGAATASPQASTLSKQGTSK